MTSHMAVLRLLDRLPWLWVTVIAAWLAVAPIVPEPHLVEKLRMLSQGTLSRPIDIFDLLFHTTPLLLLAAKAFRWLHLRRNNNVNT
jgi:hypothetical protein